MNCPNVYTPERVIKLAQMCAAGLPDGRYVAARPCGWDGISISWRLRAAWKVFTGKWDALRWEGQE